MSMTAKRTLLFTALALCPLSSLAWAQAVPASSPAPAVTAAATPADTVAPITPPAAPAADSHEHNVQELVRFCTEDLAKVEASTHSDIPEGAYTQQTNIAFGNIAVAYDRIATLCKSKEYWKRAMDNLSAGATPPPEDLKLAITVLGVMHKAYKDWEGTVATFNALTQQTLDDINQKKIEEMQRTAAERRQKELQDAEDAKRQAITDAIRAQREAIHKNLEAREHIKEQADTKKVEDDAAPRTQDPSRKKK